MAKKNVSEKLKKGKIKIDLNGPGGNAFSLIGLAGKLGLSLGLGEQAVIAIQKEMMSSDYDHLLDVFNEEFSEYVTIIATEGKRI